MSGDALLAEGVVTDLSHGFYTVRATIGGRDLEVKARLSGRMHTRRIHVLLGDRVTVEVNAYDTSKGRIVERERVAR